MSSLLNVGASSSTDDHAMAARLRRQAWLAWRRTLESQAWRSTPHGPKPGDNRLTDALIHGFAFAMKGLRLEERGRRNTLELRQTHLELSCPGLPAEFDGFRILHISDPHFDICPGLAEAIIAAATASPADICVLTGDYRAAVTGSHHQALGHFAQFMEKIRAPAGVWATLGNHDSADMAAPIEALGVGLLINEAATLHRGTAKLRLVGLDDVHKFHTPLADEALATHAPLHDQGWGIALVHSPEMASKAARLGYGLYLCGHTHGGQICLPGGRPVITHLDSHHHLARGHWRIGAMHGYTSPGAGASAVPLRYFTRSEVTRLTLRRPRPSGAP